MRGIEKMALCTSCGAIINDADILKHICEPADIPAVGQMKKPQTTAAALK
jgi:hypothetical protein